MHAYNNKIYIYICVYVSVCISIYLCICIKLGVRGGYTTMLHYIIVYIIYIYIYYDAFATSCNNNDNTGNVCVCDKIHMSTLLHSVLTTTYVHM